MLLRRWIKLMKWLVASDEEVLGAVADVIGEEEEGGSGLQVGRLDLLGEKGGVVQQ